MNLFDQIKNLIDLRDSGTISKEDFNEMLLILKNEYERDIDSEISKEKSSEKITEYSKETIINPDSKNKLNINIWLLFMNGLFVLSVMSFLTGCPSFLWNRNQVSAQENSNQVHDLDQDGIADNEDECPREYGFLFTKGCPDTDGDNVPDREDFCKDTPGTILNQGCPEKKKNIYNK